MKAHERVAGQRGGAPAVLRLEVIGGEGSPAAYEAEPGGPPVTIGRSADDNVFALHDRTVSKRHAVIECTPEGYRIRDLKSLNGVKLRGRPIPAEGAVLADGDELQLGLAVVRVGVTPFREPKPAGPPTVIEPRAAWVADKPSPPPPPPPPPPAAPRAAPPRRERREVRERLGPFEVFRSLETGSPRRLDLAVDTRTGGEATLLRVSSAELGFFGRRRFRRAHEQVPGLAHENIAAPLEVGQCEGEVYVVYPPLDGVTATTLLRDGGRDLRVELAVYVVRELCRALGHLAAKMGGAFRPAVSDREVMVGRDGRVLLLYVGDAATSAVADRYVAPEEDAGEKGDARAAVFSAGVLLYELLAREPIEARQKLTLPSIDTVRLQVPAGLAEATMRALEVRPEDRLGSAGELEQALSDALDQAAGFGAAQVGSWVMERFPE